MKLRLKLLICEFHATPCSFGLKFNSCLKQLFRCRMQRLIKNSSSPPVHKAQPGLHFAWFAIFPIDLDWNCLCTGFALRLHFFPLLFLVAKGRLVQSSGYHDLRGQFGEKGGNFSEILMLPAFTWFLTHKAISPHMNTSIML